jgi:hypothetical protein
VLQLCSTQIMYICMYRWRGRRNALYVDDVCFKCQNHDGFFSRKFKKYYRELFFLVLFNQANNIGIKANCLEFPVTSTYISLLVIFPFPVFIAVHFRPCHRRKRPQLPVSVFLKINGHIFRARLEIFES